MTVGSKKIARILCGTDFSKPARQALRVAAVLGKRLAEPVTLVHALDFPSYASKGHPDDVFRLVKASRRKELIKEARRGLVAGASVNVLLHAGRADEALVELADKSPTRLVVVASLGRRNQGRWFLGSVSERTAERASVPTLVVRDSTPFETWTHKDRPLKVFVAFNFTVTSEAALRWVKELQAIGPCELVVGYVDWPPEQRTRLGIAESVPLAGSPPDVHSILERDVRARVIELLGDIAFRLRIETNWGRPDARLAEMAKEEGSDLLVVGSHQYRGFERLWHTSVSRGLLHGAAMSVAVVPLPTSGKHRVAFAPTVRRVLVTTDFSDLANRAIPHGYSLLRGGGTLHLVNVVHPSALSVGGHLKGSWKPRTTMQNKTLVDSCLAQLRDLIPIEAVAAGIETKVDVIEHDDVAVAISQSAERFGVDVICLSTHGRSGLSKTLLGSVAQAVMQQSRRPILVVCRSKE